MYEVSWTFSFTVTTQSCLMSLSHCCLLKVHVLSICRLSDSDGTTISLHQVCLDMSFKQTNCSHFPLFPIPAYQYSVLPFGLAWAPRTFQSASMHPFPTQIEWNVHPQLSGQLADFSSVPGYAYQPHRLAAYSLGNMQKSILAPSQSITYLEVCLDSVGMRARLS